MSQDGFMPGRRNRLILTVYQDEAETQPEDLTDRAFSATVFDPRDPETALARLIGNESVVITAPTTGVIELVLPPATFNGLKATEVCYVVDEITNPAVPEQFLPADTIPITRAPSPTVPA